MDKNFNFDPNAIKDPSKLPKTVRFAFIVAAFLAGLAAGYFYDTDPQHLRLVELEQKETELMKQWRDKKQQAVNLSAYKKQLAEVEVMFGTLLKQLPNKSEMDALLNDINQAGVGRGMTFEYFRPAPRETNGDYYAELPVSIAIGGNYHELALFAEDVSKLTRIVNLDDMALKVQTQPKPGVPAKLQLTATAKTYRYLEKKGK